VGDTEERLAWPGGFERVNHGDERKSLSVPAALSAAAKHVPAAIKTRLSPEGLFSPAE